jgi:hypothetical protein
LSFGQVSARSVDRRVPLVAARADGGVSVVRPGSGYRGNPLRILARTSSGRGEFAPPRSDPADAFAALKKK